MDGPSRTDDSDDIDDSSEGARWRDEADDGDRDRPGKSGSATRFGGFRFRLPPIKLPDAAFPADLRIELPPPKYVHRAGLSARSVVVVALVFDLFDAGLALAGVGPILDWTRIVAGLGLAAALTGVYGSLYAWEAVALALGAGWLTAVPSATLLLFARGRRESGAE